VEPLTRRRFVGASIGDTATTSAAAVADLSHAWEAQHAAR
jgi:hypothetical protein